MGELGGRSQRKLLVYGPPFVICVASAALIVLATRAVNVYVALVVGSFVNALCCLAWMSWASRRARSHDNTHGPVRYRS